jgi:hypothetical protein
MGQNTGYYGKIRGQIMQKYEVNMEKYGVNTPKYGVKNLRSKIWNITPKYGVKYGKNLVFRLLLKIDQHLQKKQQINKNCKTGKKSTKMCFCRVYGMNTIFLHASFDFQFCWHY